MSARFSAFSLVLLLLIAVTSGYNCSPQLRRRPAPSQVEKFFDAVLAARETCDKKAFFSQVARNYRIIGSEQEETSASLFAILQNLCAAFPALKNVRESVARIGRDTYMLKLSTEDAENGLAKFPVVGVYTLRKTGRGYRIVTEVLSARLSDYTPASN